jgi:hypothetical protein
MGRIIKNLTLFKLGWVACVVFAAAGRPELATLSVAGVAFIHLLGVSAPLKETLLLVAAALVGLGWESLMLWSGTVQYPGYPDSVVLAPYWIVAMWVLFATTINHGLRWVKRSGWVAALAGLFGGPAAFYGGMKLGAVTFSEPVIALGIIGLGWAALLPALVVIADTIIDSTRLEPRAKVVPTPVRTSVHLKVGYE